MAKKNTGDKSLVISDDFFKTLIPITDENISNMFGFDSVFFFVDIKKNKKELIRTITIDRQYFKGNNEYTWYWDSGFKTCIIKFSSNESDCDFNERILSYKKIIKDGIKKRNIYWKKINRENAD